MDTADKSLAADKIEWVKFSGARWAPDSKGFYYSAYDAPKQNAYSSKNEFQKVYYHALGTPQSADRLIYEDREHPLRYFSAWPSEDGKWLFVIASEGTSGTEVLYKRVSDPKFRVLLPGFDADYSPVDCKDDRLYYVTNRDASNYALMKVDLNRPGMIETVIPESERNLLEGVGTAGGSLFAYYLQDAQSRIYQYDYAGKQVREVALPAIGSVGGFDGREEDSELYYTLVNYTAPATIYKYDIASGESTLYKAPEVNFDPELFTTEQIFYTSKDGTRVPMFVTHRKDMKLDGENPCLLYGYGGFQINMTPGFNPSALMFVEQGGIYCVANLRGGSEYGEEWHKAGMLENKQNVFDDFIAAAEYLIARKYTSKERWRSTAARTAACSWVPARCSVRTSMPCACRSGGDGHAPLPQVHVHHLGRAREDEEYGSTVSPDERGVSSRDARDDGRSRRPRRAGAFVQVRRHDAALPGGRQTRAHPHRVEGGARSRETHLEADRRGDGHVRLPVPEYRCPVQARGGAEVSGGNAVRANNPDKQGKCGLRTA